MDAFKRFVSDLYADMQDGLEDNPRAVVTAFVAGVVVCGVAVIVF